LRDIVFVFERNSHESGLKCDLLRDYRTIFRPPQAFAIGLEPFAAVPESSFAAIRTASAAAFARAAAGARVQPGYVKWELPQVESAAGRVL
jgi:hypothetical protein